MYPNERTTKNACLAAIAAAVALLLMVRLAVADEITIGAANDTTIFEGSPNNSDGGGPGMFAGTDGTGNALRGLLRFDVAGTVPAGSTITGVQLTLSLGIVAGGDGSPDPTPRTISLYRATASWGEGTNGNTFTSIGGTGGGFPANPGDATWNSRFYDPTTPALWTTPGGDAAATASASLSVGNSLVAYTWTSTPGMISDAQGWLNSPAANFGWLVENGSETSLRTFRAFWTREASNPSLRPQLQITFNPGLPGDANGDGRVDLLDLLALASNYNQPDPKTWVQGDFNGDGVVGAADLEILASHWQSGAAPLEPGTLATLGLPDPPMSVPDPSGASLLALAAISLIPVYRPRISSTSDEGPDFSRKGHSTNSAGARLGERMWMSNSAARYSEIRTGTGALVDKRSRPGSICCRHSQIVHIVCPNA